MTREALALSNFDAGMNCAQVVAGAYTDITGIPVEHTYALACGFGAGMGRLQETCGAVTGAFMVIGSEAFKKHAGAVAQKNSANDRIQEFAMRFKKIKGTLDCKTLLNVDLNTAQGQSLMSEYNLRELVCKNCIKDSMSIVDDLLGM